MADRSVSVRLRADVTAFIAAMRAAERAVNRFGDEAERAGRRSSEAYRQSGDSAERLERELRRLLEVERQHQQQQRRSTDETERNTRETQRSTAATSNRTRALISLGAAAAMVTGEAAAAATALGAFGLVAAPSILKVVSAQQDLAGSWSSLSGLQRESATHVDLLVDQYKDLAKSYEPQALGAFNSMVSTARTLLPELGNVVGATGDDVLRFTNRLGDFLTGRGTEFLQWSAKEAPQALDLLGSNLTVAGDTALDLVEDMAPLGVGLLQLTHGTLSAVNAVAGMNPMLAQFAVSALLLRAPLMGAAGAVGNTRDRMRAFSAANQGASRSTRLLHGAMAAGPALYVAAGAALVLFAVHVANAKTETDKLIEGLKVQHRATGNNLAGYQSLRNELHTRYIAAVYAADAAHQKANKTYQSSKEGTDELRQRAERLRAEAGRMKEEIDATDTSFRNVNTAAQQLGARYNVTAEQANRMATAAGVDLSTALDGTGAITAKAQGKIDLYRQSVELSNDPTHLLSLSLKDAGNQALTMKDRVTALQTATDNLLSPTLRAYNATTQLREGFRQIGEQITAAKGRMDGGTAASDRLRGSFGRQIQTVSELHAATLQQTGNINKANGAVSRYIPILYAMAGRSRDSKLAVDALARTTGNVAAVTNTSRESFMRAAEAMRLGRSRAEALWKELNKIKDRRAEVTVTAKGSWHAKQQQQWGGYAKGGQVYSSDPSASQAYDSVPAMLRLNEHVWTPEEVDAVGGHAAMYRMRAMARAGALQGYARGGKVSLSHDQRSTSNVVGDVVQPINLGIFGMVTSIAKLFAAEYKRLMSGGSVVAAARSQIGLPYSWGGGGKGGPSRGIGRGAGTVGFDCSGLTEYAWWRGRRVSIGGVTYSQHPNSTRIGSPKPGALGFNSSLGHVVLASNKPGYVIEAPYTGARVREVRKSMPDWRWPKGAGKAEGGAVTELDRRLGRRFVEPLTVGALTVEAKSLQIAGDPGGLGIPGYARGGWVSGRPGQDTNLLRATAGEFVINRRAAGDHRGLLEAVNAGRVGEAMVRPTIRASSVMSGASGGAAFGRGGDVHVHLDLHNHGAIGSKLEMQNWLSKSLDDLDWQGRVPWVAKRLQ